MPVPTQPRVAIVYEPESIPLLALTATAARNGFHLVWVTDGVDVRMLERLGSVVATKGLSVDEVAERLTQLDVSGITTFADGQIEMAAALASRLGLPGNSLTAAHRLVNKIAQRQALANADLPGPAFVGIESPSDITAQRQRLDELKYPVVVKPTVGFGGLNTFSLPTATAVHSELEDRRHSGLWESTIIEECLGTFPPTARNEFGDYVSVEMVIATKVVSVVAITGRMPLAEPFRETGAFLPSTLDPAEQSDVIDMAVRAARALDVSYGCLHIEIKLTDAGPRVIEVNGRVPGGGIVDLVSTFTGIDLFECAIKSALGYPIQLEADAAAGGVCYRLALQPPLGRRVHLRHRWADQTRKIPGLEHITLRSAEAEVDIRDGSYGYLLMAAGVADDHGALLDTQHALTSLLVTDGHRHLAMEDTMGEPHPRVLAHLNSSNTPYLVMDHATIPTAINSPVDFAAALGYPLGRIMKTLLCRPRSTGNYVAVVCSVDARIDFKYIAAELNCGRLEVANAHQLQEATHYPSRGVSPLGLDDQVAVVVASHACNYDTVLVGGGAVGIEIEIAPRELIRITGAKVLDLNPRT